MSGQLHGPSDFTLGDILPPNHRLDRHQSRGKCFVKRQICPYHKFKPGRLKYHRPNSMQRLLIKVTKYWIITSIFIIHLCPSSVKLYECDYRYYSRAGEVSKWFKEGFDGTLRAKPT